MARYKPSRELQVVTACEESWEAMAGDSRQRHCEGCRRDVLNVAAMTPRALEAMLAAPGPLPCMRLTLYADGSLLMARETRQLSWWHRAMTAGAALIMTTGAVAQRLRGPRHAKNVAVQAAVVDSAGSPTGQNFVMLTDLQAPDVESPVDTSGRLLFQTPTETYPVHPFAPHVNDVGARETVVSSSAVDTAITPGPHATRVVMGGPAIMQSVVARRAAVKVDLGLRPVTINKP